MILKVYLKSAFTKNFNFAVYLGYLIFFYIGRLWGLRRKCYTLFMCVFMNPQIKFIRLTPTEIALAVIWFNIWIRRSRKVVVYWWWYRNYTTRV